MLVRSTILARCCLTLFIIGLFASDAVAADESTEAGATDVGSKLPLASTKKIDFERDIQPIFSAKCYACHSHKKQESGYRLDRKKGAMTGGDSGVAIVPNKSAESSLVLLIAAIDPDRVMPPEGDRLSKEQVGLIRAWIDQGAVWPDSVAGGSHNEAARDHWAYKPCTRPVQPKVTGNQWVRNSVDTFVLARLNAHSVKPSPTADRHTLIRRLSLDLLGLPPSPQQVDAFVNDSSPEAYEKLVDRLLKSPHFGERWGRNWLDKARYADSDGYEKDRARPNAWRWRDWVIQAVNDDMPFDRFTIEQLAGDLLPNSTDDQKLATAFHRQTLTNTEGGTDQEQWRVEAVFDRVETTGTVWLGLTLQCARCHSHKYEPITQREYYQLFAFLNNGDETNRSVPISDEEVARYRREKTAKDKAIVDYNRLIADGRSKMGPAMTAWQERTLIRLAVAAADPVRLHPLDIVSVEGPKGVTFQKLDDGSWLASGTSPVKATYTIKAKSLLAAVTGFRIEALAHDSLPGKGPGRSTSGNFVLSELRVHASDNGQFKDEHKVSLTSPRSEFAQSDFPASNAIDGNEKTGWAIGSKVGRNHSFDVLTSKPIGFTGDTWLQLTLSQQHGKKLTLGRFRIMAMTGTHADRIAPKPVRNILAIESSKRNEKQKAALADYYAGIDPQVGPLVRQLADLKNHPPRSPNMTVRVLSERTKNRRITKVFKRGDFLRPLGEVKPETPELLHSFSKRDGTNGPDRLDFAHWLMDPDNPLTARVAVNHLWLHLFGTGLVGTVNDFGVRGEKPSHPQLLDWLATEYIRLGWSRKKMIKRIVMSATYRQSSAHRAELSNSDPQNAWLARQNRFRVEAEIIRDVTLSAAGLLSSKIGGPSVFPPMPADVAALSYAGNFKWTTSKNEDRFRRGMYTFFKRTAPHPNLTTFDCPDANTTCVSRNKSNTPLQALTTLNNEVYVEASQALARRVLSDKTVGTEKSGKTADAERLAYAFRLCISRRPSEMERDKMLELLDSSRKWYGEHSDDAKKAVGKYLPKGVSANEAAAWIAAVRIIMNFDEFITRE